MKRILTALCMASALALTVQAEETTKEAPKKPAMTEEQKALKKEFTVKYDENKDGKLSKAEREKMSAEDKAKWEKAFPAPAHHEKEHEKEKSTQ